MKTMVLPKQACILALFYIATASASLSQTVSTLLNFNSSNDRPNFLMEGNDSNLYGLSALGGHGYGTFFESTVDGTLTTLYEFCSRTNCSDGQGPLSLLETSDGSFFGLTSGGSFEDQGNGTLFQITPAGGLRILHYFCTQTNCTDGSQPSGFIQGIDGKFYGTTVFGGAYNHGTVFSITTNGEFDILYSFCAQTNCVDGAEPYSGLIQADNGMLYGTTSFGGSAGPLNQGTIFRITTAGTFTSLYSFSNNGRDSIPNGLIQGADGNLYGTSQSIGTTGTAFQFTLAGKYKSLHTFCQTRTCADGSNPLTALTQGTDGSLYGTTSMGAGAGDGAIFQIAPTGAFNVLYTFCSQTCADGVGSSSLTQHTDGTFYAVDEGGGTFDDGTLYSLSMGLGPFAKASPRFGKAGISVGILGQNLTGSTSVMFNGTPAVFTVNSDTYITATVPTNATTGTIQVITPSGTLNSNVAFQVLP